MIIEVMVVMDTEGQAKHVFARWLESVLSAHNWGVRTAAKEFRITPSALSQLLAADNQPRLETIRLIAARLNLAESAVLAHAPLSQGSRGAPTLRELRSEVLSGATGVSMIPVLDQEAGAGEGVAVLEYEYISPTVAAKRNVIGVKIRGDCMAPRIEHGDVVVVDRDASWSPGKVVLAQADERLIVKRAISARDGMVLLRADNPSFVPRDAVVPEANILGVLIKVIKTL